MVNLVPILHRVELTVQIVDEADSSPITNAMVIWSNTSHARNQELGQTDSTGSAQLVTHWIQENPSWLWPKIGTFKFQHQVLLVEAPSYEDEIVRLSEVFPDLAYSHPKAQLRIPMRKSSR